MIYLHPALQRHTYAMTVMADKTVTKIMLDARTRFFIHTQKTWMTTASRRQ